MLVSTDEPRDPTLYSSCNQDGIQVYYTSRLGRKTELLELDYVRILFSRRPILAGPEELLAKIIMSRV